MQTKGGKLSKWGWKETVIQARLFLNSKRTCPVFLFTAIFNSTNKAALPQGPPKEKKGGMVNDEEEKDHSQWMCACVFTHEDMLGLR